MTGWGEDCQYDQLLYDRSLVRSSLVEDFQLVCDRAGLRTLVNTTYMLGLLVGAYLIGWFSDRHGRVPALALGLLLVSISGFSAAFCSGPLGLIVFSVLRFITGIGGMACFMVSFVLIVEHVSYRSTMMVGIGINIPFALGEFLLGLEAYFIRDWRTLQMVAHGPLIALIMVGHSVLNRTNSTFTFYRFSGNVPSL